MGGHTDEPGILDPRKLPGFGPDWRRDITGAWCSPNEECYRGVVKHVGTEQSSTSIELAWGCDWLEDDGTQCMMNRGLHFGLPEAPVECGLPLPLPPYTGLGIVAVVGPETYDWEPSMLEQRALGCMWARMLRHVYSASECELCFVPSWIGEKPEELGSYTPEGIAGILDHFVSEFECRKVAQFEAADYRVDDAQLLPWGYVCCPHERLEDAFAQGGGAGATGFIVPRGRSEQVRNWARVVSPVVRLDAQLDACLLMFEVLWHGEALAILSRLADPDDIENARRADNVVALVRRLKPRGFEPGETVALDDTSAPWLSNSDE